MAVCNTICRRASRILEDTMSSLRALKTLCLVAALGSLPLFPFRATAQSATAPTASNSAESLADAGARASAKYDGPRNALLADVERGVQSGQFRAEWNSLSQYQVPDWYRD